MTDGVMTLVASFEAVSAVQAVRWVHDIARRLASSLDTTERVRALRWLDGSQCHAALDGLVDGMPFEFSVSCGRTRVTWTVQQVWFLALADRVGRRLPDCAGRFACASSAPDHHCGGEFR